MAQHPPASSKCRPATFSDGTYRPNTTRGNSQTPSERDGRHFRAAFGAPPAAQPPPQPSGLLARPVQAPHPAPRLPMRPCPWLTCPRSFLVFLSREGCGQAAEVSAAPHGRPPPPASLRRRRSSAPHGPQRPARPQRPPRAALSAPSRPRGWRSAHRRRHPRSWPSPGPSRTHHAAAAPHGTERRRRSRERGKAPPPAGNSRETSLRLLLPASP